MNGMNFVKLEDSIPVSLQTWNTERSTLTPQPRDIQETQEPLFLLGQSPRELFLSKLYNQKIIDANGRLSVDLTKFYLSPNASDRNIERFLDNEIFIEIGDQNNFYKHLVMSLKSMNIIDKQNKLIWCPNDPNISASVKIGKQNTMPYTQ